MDKKNSFKIELNLFFLILLVLALFTIIGDALCYIFNLNYIIQCIISALIVFLVLCIVKNKFNISKDIEKNDIIFFVFLTFILFISLPFTDQMYDTLNYHLYVQERPFIDKIFEDFLPGRWINSYSYAFPDRMFYFFRYFLGYRMGIILNYLTLVVLYYQIKKILKKYLNVSNFMICLVCIFLTFNLSVLEQIDDYYVDLLSLVFLLELFILSLEKNNENNFFVKSLLFMFICGICFAIKFTNAFLILIFGTIYLFNNFKNIRNLVLYQYILLFLTFIIPFASYMIYTFLETGNPVFPFYNNIFKSKYYLNEPWMDLRFGPKSIFELIIWPIIACLFPNRTADTHICEPMWAIGYVISILFLMSQIVSIIKNKEINKKTSLLCIITITVYLVWSKFLLGYTRYAIIVVLVGSISCIVCLYEFIKKKKIVMISFIILSLIINYAYTGYNYLYSKKSLFYNNIFNTRDDLNIYKYNVKNLFDNNQNSIEFPKKSVWGVIAEDSGACIMLQNDMNIINLTYGATNAYTNEILEKNLNKYEHVYSLVKYSDLDYFINRMNEYGWDIVTIYSYGIPDYLENIGIYYIIEIEKGNYNDSIEQFFQSIVKDVSEYKNINFNIAPSPYLRQLLNDNYNIEIIGVNDLEKVKIETKTKNTKDLMLKFENIDVKNYDEILIRVVKDGKEYPINVILINFEGVIEK